MCYVPGSLHLLLYFNNFFSLFVYIRSVTNPIEYAATRKEAFHTIDYVKILKKCQLGNIDGSASFASRTAPEAKG